PAVWRHVSLRHDLHLLRWLRYSGTDASNACHQPEEHREVLSARPAANLRAAANLTRLRARRIRLDYGALRRRQVDAAAHHGHARRVVVRRVLPARRAAARARQARTRGVAEEAHR